MTVQNYQAEPAVIISPRLLYQIARRHSVPVLTLRWLLKQFYKSLT